MALDKPGDQNSTVEFNNLSLRANVGVDFCFATHRNNDGVTEDYLKSGTYELVVAQEKVPATLHLDPLYDPAGERVKA